ncbi:hypothetical protein BpHYR1_021869 [Brachionus plicatilis]|uniref:Transmembrane protein n=1 Tax=Brachionus plicatilis TaxID=10195 RepID=A0A3M7T413_BRAPC|nr:hypothetical protein BpHYR1_021869 [Brachionus plicatilis]
MSRSEGDYISPSAYKIWCYIMIQYFLKYFFLTLIIFLNIHFKFFKFGKKFNFKKLFLSLIEFSQQDLKFWQIEILDLTIESRKLTARCTEYKSKHNLKSDCNSKCTNKTISTTWPQTI